MVRGSKFGREFDSRASRRVRLLRELNRLRASKPRDQTAIERHEAKLFELDQITGYDRCKWLRQKDESHYKAMQHGENCHAVSQATYRALP